MEGHLVSPATSERNASAEILAPEQAAEFLGVKPRTLRFWREVRGLPFIRISKSCVRYRRSDLNAWLDKHAVGVPT